MNKACTIYKTTDLVGKRWTLPILLELYKGDNYSKRYSQIKKAIPDITPKILSSRLKELEEKGMIKKIVDATEFPVSSVYSLSKSGIEFIKIIKNIKAWALKWNLKNKTCVSIHDCKDCEF